MLIPIPFRQENAMRVDILIAKQHPHQSKRRGDRVTRLKIYLEEYYSEKKPPIN
jgi:hypothetical protein